MKVMVSLPLSGSVPSLRAWSRCGAAAVADGNGAFLFLLLLRVLMRMTPCTSLHSASCFSRL